MEAIMDLQLTLLQLKKINTCQMSLQVTTLAEISDHTGTQLLPQATTWTKDKPPSGLQDISHLQLEWPTVHLPSLSCWRLWTHTIRTLFTGNAKGMQLQTPLGPWNTHYQTYQFWQWRISPWGSLLCQMNPTSCPHAAILLRHTRRYDTFSTTIPTNQQFNGHPVTPLDLHHRHVDLPVMAPTMPPRENTVLHFSSFVQQFRSQLQPWQKPLFGPIKRLCPTNHLRNLLQNKQQVSIVTDASLQKTIGVGLLGSLPTKTRQYGVV